MFKKRVFSLLIVTLLALLLAMALSGCRKDESSESVDATEDVVVKEEKKVELLNEPRWVTADAGLRMRDSAGSSGDKIGLIPYGEQVTLLLEEGAEETIAGANGRWSKVKWQEQEGWVFGGFLSTEQPAVVEESVGDENESSGKTILIDGKEFDESVLYGLYLIEFKDNYYQLFELLPDNIQKSYVLMKEYDEKLFHEIYLGFPDEYINLLNGLPEPKRVLRDVGVGVWLYNIEKSILQTTFFFELSTNNIEEYKVDIKVSLEDNILKYTFLKSDNDELNYFYKSSYRIIKLKR